MAASTLDVLPGQSSCIQQIAASVGGPQLQQDQGKGETNNQKANRILKTDVTEDTSLIGDFILRHVIAANCIPKDAFKGVKGVVFLQAASAAAGFTAFRGKGFVVANINGQWSAPAFIKLGSLGVGLSLGGEVVDTIAILYRDEDVEMYKEGDFKIKAYRVGDPLAALENISGDRHPEVFTAKSGKLLNYSINGGGVTHDLAADAKLYGALVSPADILNGKVDPPEKMKDFYRALTALAAYSALGLKES